MKRLLLLTLSLIPTIALAQTGLLLLGAGGTGGGTKSVIDHGAMSPNTVGTATASVTLNCTGANFGVIALSVWNGGGLAAPTDSNGNTWTQLGTWQAGDPANGDSLGVFYSANMTASSSQTFSQTDFVNSIAAACFSNVAISSHDVLRRHRFCSCQATQ